MVTVSEQYQLEQENKQLKDEIENERNKLGLCSKQHDNLKQKLEQTEKTNLNYIGTMLEFKEYLNPL